MFKPDPLSSLLGPPSRPTLAQILAHSMRKDNLQGTLTGIAKNQEQILHWFIDQSLDFWSFLVHNILPFDWFHLVLASAGAQQVCFDRPWGPKRRFHTKLPSIQHDPHGIRVEVVKPFALVREGPFGGIQHRSVGAMRKHLIKWGQRHDVLIRAHTDSNPGGYARLRWRTLCSPHGP